MAETRELAHADDCYPGDACVECGGCGCGVIPGTCTGPGCQSLDEHEQRRDESGYDEEPCSYGCH